jgi:hypothetical protein
MKQQIDNILNFAFNKENHIFYWVMYEIQNNEIKIIDALIVPDITENKYCNMKDAPAYNQYAEKAFLQFKGRCESLEDAKTETLISIVNHFYKNRNE